MFASVTNQYLNTQYTYKKVEFRWILRYDKKEGYCLCMKGRQT